MELLYKMRKILQTITISLIWVLVSCSKPDPIFYATKVSDAFLARNTDHIITYNENREKHKWHYEQGLMLTALNEQYLATNDEKYLEFIKQNIDLYVNEEGEIETYKPKTFKLDDIVPGRALLILYEKTGNKKYWIALEKLVDQLHNQPRTSEGGFWHKKIYPYQMWLDGLYMALPFYGQYAKLTNDPSIYDDIILQFKLMQDAAHDEKTGLLFHGWDEKRAQKWADPETGLSKSFWARAMGWYMMALVDVLDVIPEGHSGRDFLIGQLQTYSKNLVKYRDKNSGVWYQVLDQAEREGNYLESSSTAMFMYAFAKGANSGYLSKDYLSLAMDIFSDFNAQFISYDSNGYINIEQTCSSAGLGGKNDRDGSFEYYLSEPIRKNDCKALGPYIMASLELSGKGK